MVVVQLLVALVHVVRPGSYLHGTLYVLYYSYFSDVAIPFGMYFLMCLVDARVDGAHQDFPPGLGRVDPAGQLGYRFVRFLRDWRPKALLVFGVASFTEVLQAFGVPLLGRTFDPLDFVMFAGGVLLAAFADRFLLRRLVPSWSRGER